MSDKQKVSSRIWTWLFKSIYHDVYSDSRFRIVVECPESVQCTIDSASRFSKGLSYIPFHESSYETTILLFMLWSTKFLMVWHARNVEYVFLFLFLWVNLTLVHPVCKEWNNSRKLLLKIHEPNEFEEKLWPLSKITELVHSVDVHSLFFFYLAVNKLNTEKMQNSFFFNSKKFWLHKMFLTQT